MKVLPFRRVSSQSDLGSLLDAKLRTLRDLRITGMPAERVLVEMERALCVLRSASARAAVQK